MNEKIAVFVDANGVPANFYFSEKINFYEYVFDGWICFKEITLVTFSAKSAAQVRAEAIRRLKLIDECNIVASSEIAGIPFTVFDMAGKSIFTIDTITDELLTDISKEVEKAENSITRNNSVPVEHCESGYYFMDLISLQKANPEISSKKALKEFLENTPFMELTLICSHIPPWIENSGLYDITCKSENEHVTATIRKHLCNE